MFKYRLTGECLEVVAEGDVRAKEFGVTNVSSVFQVNSFVEKAYVTLAFAEHMHGGAKKKQRDASPWGIS